MKGATKRAHCATFRRWTPGVEARREELSSDIFLSLIVFPCSWRRRYASAHSFPARALHVFGEIQALANLLGAAHDDIGPTRIDDRLPNIATGWEFLDGTIIYLF
jgi:hypothetical protein